MVTEIIPNTEERTSQIYSEFKALDPKLPSNSAFTDLVRERFELEAEFETALKKVDERKHFVKFIDDEISYFLTRADMKAAQDHN